ncbi:MAG: hypothetical protein HQK76_18855 [Desulfobacterales bacterium]|nr:hypothetical protein [Desulfobacterales bacterium]
MMDIISRLIKIGKAYALYSAKYIDKLSDFDPEEFTRDFNKYSRDKNSSNTDYNYDFKTSSSFSGIPKQVIEDLTIFNLKPPSSLAEVKKARIREIKKCHADKFVNDSEKLKAANKIMQIYNTAYDRLEIYYNNKGAA